MPWSLNALSNHHSCFINPKSKQQSLLDICQTHYITLHLSLSLSLSFSLSYSMEYIRCEVTREFNDPYILEERLLSFSFVDYFINESIPELMTFSSPNQSLLRVDKYALMELHGGVLTSCCPFSCTKHKTHDMVSIDIIPKISFKTTYLPFYSLLLYAAD